MGWFTNLYGTAMVNLFDNYYFLPFHYDQSKLFFDSIDTANDSGHYIRIGWRFYKFEQYEYGIKREANNG